MTHPNMSQPSTTHPNKSHPSSSPANRLARAARRASVRGSAAGLAIGLFAGVSALTAAAHPHVWVSVETTVLYDKGTVTGLAHKWTFDEMYTAMAIQGLDANNDGTYDRAELSELAQVNIDGLKEFDYFTYAKLGQSAVPLAEPRDYWLEYKDGVLSLHLVTPLAQPVLAEAEGLSFTVTDPSYFIAFDLAKTDPVKISQGAPAGCVATITAPQEDQELAQRLGQAMQEQLGGSDTLGLGVGVTRSIVVSCPKS